MPGARRIRSLVRKVLVAHECSHHGRTGTPGIPARNGFNGFLALPGDRACLSPSSAVLLADFTSASRRQGRWARDAVDAGSALIFLKQDWTTQITLKVLAFLPSRRTPEVFGERPVGQGFGQMQPADLVRAVEVGQRAGDAQHAMIAARRQPHGFGGVAQ